MKAKTVFKTICGCLLITLLVTIITACGSETSEVVTPSTEKPLQLTVSDWLYTGTRQLGLSTIMQFKRVFLVSDIQNNYFLTRQTDFQGAKEYLFTCIVNGEASQERVSLEDLPKETNYKIGSLYKITPLEETNLQIDIDDDWKVSDPSGSTFLLFYELLENNEVVDVDYSLIAEGVGELSALYLDNEVKSHYAKQYTIIGVYEFSNPVDDKMSFTFGDIRKIEMKHTIAGFDYTALSILCDDPNATGIGVYKLNNGNGISFHSFVMENGQADLIYSGLPKSSSEFEVVYYSSENSIRDLEKHILTLDLSNEKPSIGMDKAMVLRTSWGSPSKVNKTTTAGGVHEQWVYSASRYVYFDDGVVTSIQESY